MNISFKPISEIDRDFLREVYASTRSEELALVDWDEKQKAAFLEMQFSAQYRFYQENYADADFFIVILDNIPVGRFYIARWPNEIRIVDLALLPEYRNAGIGSFILQGVINESIAAHKPVRIHVERFNRALFLYRRLGFVEIGEHGVYFLMERYVAEDDVK